MTLTTEIVYRGTVLLVLISFSVVRGHFQSRSKQISVVNGRQQQRDRKYYRLVGAAYLFALIYALSPWFDFAQVAIPTWLRCFGGTLAFAGLFGVWWTHASLGRNWSGILEL